MADRTSSPTVRLLCVGRNDSYHSDYLERTKACINYNLQEIAAAGLTDVLKIVIVDWCSTEPLHTVIPVSKKYSSLVEFLYASKAYVESCGLNPDIVNLTGAVNIGLAHSTCDYAFHMASDQVANSLNWRKLYDYIVYDYRQEDTEGLMLVERAYLHPDLFKDSLSFESLHEYLNTNPPRSAPISGSGSGASAFGGRMSLWSKIGGMNEQYSAWGGNDSQLFIDSLPFGDPRNLTTATGACLYKFPYAKKGTRINVVRSYFSNKPRIETTYNFIAKKPKGAISSFSQTNLGDNERHFPVVEEKDEFKKRFFLCLFSSVDFPSAIECFHMAYSAAKRIKSASPGEVIVVGSFPYKVLIVLSRLFPVINFTWYYPREETQDVFKWLNAACGISDYYLTFTSSSRLRAYAEGEILNAKMGRRVSSHRKTLQFRINNRSIELSFLSNYMAINRGHAESSIPFRKAHTSSLLFLITNLGLALIVLTRMLMASSLTFVSCRRKLMSLLSFY